MKQDLSDAAQRTDLVRRLRRVAPDTQRRWGKMTAHQAVCHLSDSFRAMMGTGVSSVANPWSRIVIKWIALNAPMKWPQGVPTRPEVDQLIGGTRPVEFTRDREQLELLMEQFAARTGDNLQAHPIFGPLGVEDWARTHYKHGHHHLLQFGLLEAPESP